MSTPSAPVPSSSAPPAAAAPSSSSAGVLKRKPEDEANNVDKKPRTDLASAAAAHFSSPSKPADGAPKLAIPKKTAPAPSLVKSAAAPPAKAANTQAPQTGAAKPPAPAASAAPKPKPKPMSDSDSDDETPLFQKVLPKLAAKPAVAAKPASKPAAAKPAPAKPAPKPAAPAKKPVADDDDDDEDEYEEDDDDEDEDDEGGDEEEDEEDAPKKKARGGAEKSSKKDKKAAAAMKNITANSCDKYTMKSKAEALVERNGANKWWEREKKGGDIKWETLDHNGPILAPAYVPHNVPILYEGKPVKLTPEVEEVATMYGAMLETDYVKSPIFNKNFFRDWRALKDFPKDVIKSLEKCDFTAILNHVKNESAKRKLERKVPEVKKAEKAEKDELTAVYGWALVDGYKEKMANPKVEPPGLFRGRGAHPKTGTLKRRIQPEDITINIGRDQPIPKCPDGHKWKGVIHNNTVTWLAFWLDNVNGAFKYMWLAPSSRFKGESDRMKYAKAIRLKDKIKDIRSNYNKELTSPHYQFRQRSTAIYLIDVLALRVGNEKDTSEVADTVGCCSLRVEHIKFEAPDTITLDFLGKDSMRYFNTVKVDVRVFKNLQQFCAGKKATDDIFDSLTTTLLNDHLKNLMEGLTAKVFRTYNASITLQKELYENPDNAVDRDESVAQKLVIYNRANREVAILCNHQKSVSKGHESAMGKLQDTLEALKDEQEEYEDLIEAKEKKKVSKDALKERQKERDERFEARWERRKKELIEKGAKDGKSEKDVKALVAAEEEKLRKKKTPSDLESAVDKLKLRIENYEAKIALKDDSKEVSLGTSKINYMDPRITVAWCKAKDVPIEKIFGQSLLAKFPWAMEVRSDWRF